MAITLRTITGFCCAVLLWAAGAAAREPAPAWPLGGKPAGTAELLVFLAPDGNPSGIIADYGVTVIHRLQSDPNAYVFGAASVSAASANLPALSADSRVRLAVPNEPTHFVRCAFVPNDSYFHRNTPTAAFPGQWHLVNEFVAGRDARVQGAWNRDLTGGGVVIGVVDDGVETTHPDLAANYVASDSFDFGQNDANPAPVFATDVHGTAVAGVAAARGGNAVGVTGAAPSAGIAGLRIDFAAQTTAMLVDAAQYHSTAAGASIAVKVHGYSNTTPYVGNSALAAALTNSAAAGTIHVFAAGNNRGAEGEDCGKLDPLAAPNVLVVTAMGSDGRFTEYGDFGANVVAAAPSDSQRSPGLFGITTTDRTNESAGLNGAADAFPDSDYTSRFGGTSAAAAVTAGVMALAKQAMPSLETRLAKHLLARSCDVVDPADLSLESDGGWRTNAAGFHFNQNYGFGLINADAMTQLATQFNSVTPLATGTTGTVAVNAAIPDGNPVGASRNAAFNPANPKHIEEVLVTLDVTHTYRGDLEGYLTSPAGTVQRLFLRSVADAGQNLQWTFVAHGFWGETPGGTWTLKLVDNFGGDVGTWNSYAITWRMGDPTMDTTPATVNEVDSTKPNGAYRAGDIIDIRVFFSEPLFVIGTPLLELATGAVNRRAPYVSGSGTNVLVFRYVVQPGDSSPHLDYTGINALTLNGGTIRDAARNNAVLTLPPPGGPSSLGSNNNFIIDTTPPSLSISPPSTGLTSGGPVTFVLSYGGAQTITLTPAHVALNATGTANAAIGVFGAGATARLVTLSNITGDGTLGISIVPATAIDAATNPAPAAGPSATFSVDNTPPQVVIGNPTPSATKHAPVEYVVTYSSASAVTLSPADVTMQASGNATATFSIAGMGVTQRIVTFDMIDGDGTIAFSISAGSAVDPAGNPAPAAGPGAAFTVDNTPPSAVIGAPNVPITRDGPVTFNVAYSGASAITLNVADVTLIRGGTADATVGVSGGGVATRTVTLSGITGDGTLAIALAAGTASDAVGHLAAAVAAGPVVAVDHTPPTASISLPTVSQTCGTPFRYTITYANADVVSLADADVTVIHTGTASARATVSGSGLASRTITLDTLLGTGTLAISIAANTARDAAGNAAPAVGPSAIVQVGEIPGVPAGVDASDATYCRAVRVSWQAVAGAVVYEVLRNAVNDPSTAVVIATTGALELRDATAAAGSPSFYWVRATNACGAGPLGVPNGGSPGAAPSLGAGEMTGDGVIDGEDISAFVACLIDGSCGNADLDCDGQLNAQDAAVFVQVLLRRCGDSGPLPAGDVSGDARVDAADIQPFVNCLLAGTTAGTCVAADMNCDGAVTGADVGLFTGRLLAP